MSNTKQDNTRKVIILNRQGGLVFEGLRKLTNFEHDKETECLIADCQLEKGLTVLVWKIDNTWQGWV